MIRPRSHAAALLIAASLLVTAVTLAKSGPDPDADDLRRVTGWVIDARDLTPGEVAALEARLADSAGSDIEARAKLWSHASTVGFVPDPDPELLKRYREHTLWVIENVPGSVLARQANLWPSVPRVALADERLGGRFPTAPILLDAMAAWEAALTRYPDDLAVRANAARFYSLPNTVRCRELLEGGLVADRDDPAWPLELGALHDRMASVGAGEGFSYLLAYGYHAVAQDRATNDGLRDRLEVRMAESALAAGDAMTAAEHARTALERVTALADADAQGQIVHDANLVLGQVALDAGDASEAASYLRQAGTTRGSAVLGSFGPDLALADALLQAGEREAVLAYLDACAGFWARGRENVGQWIATIREGGTPRLDRRAR